MKKEIKVFMKCTGLIHRFVYIRDDYYLKANWCMLPLSSINEKEYIILN